MVIATFDTKKAIELYIEGLSYREIYKLLNVKGSTLRMFYSNKIRQGIIQTRITVGRKKLKQIRLQKKLTQKNLADRVGISRAYYSKIENCKEVPSYTIVKLIKIVLEYLDDDLFEIYENKEKS